MTADQHDANEMKKVTEKQSRIGESNYECIANDIKDETYDDNIMLKFDEDGNFIS